MITLGNSVLDKSELIEYLIDASQRTVLFWNVMRQRGNQYLEQIAKEMPHVLYFDYELMLDGKTLALPVNYALIRIIPPEGIIIDKLKRPFVVIDPRAGHVPGIGGFKANSEIGEAIRAGHACYFVKFSPLPEPAQTVETVIEAWAEFVQRVSDLHADADGKPVVIGNCQAGWALMMLAAKYPDLCGPILAAGSPLSYWAGVRGSGPMRYMGGLLGGSWLTAFLSDIGNGNFDGAWLVQNFENVNPANTLWTKQYNLYANIDTEPSRYLGFERWWGGHVVLTGEEMQYIVDNLFIGNKLSMAQIVTSDNVRLDFRNIRSPIICLCSKGDEITPPQQALGWILDLYESDEDIVASGQTIVYSVHERIGHLGIFVSGSVVEKEHQEFTNNIDLIDCLPPGLYEAVIREKMPDTINIDLVTGTYISRFERRDLNDIRSLGWNTLDEERCFAAVAQLSEAMHGFYRTTIQQIVRSFANEESASWLRRIHPIRLGYEIFSDRNLALRPVETMAQISLQNRQPVAVENMFLQWEKMFSDWVTWSLNAFRDWRDRLTEEIFFGIYGQTWLQSLLGLRASDPPRRSPGRDSDHLIFVEHQIRELTAKMDKGGPREAAIRSLIYILKPEKAADERVFQMLRRIRAEQGREKSLSEFKQDVREQYLMLRLDEDRALELIPKLLQSEENDRLKWMEYIRKVAIAGGPLNLEGQRRLAHIEGLLTL